VTEPSSEPALLADDARFTMPPLPAWFSGRADIGRFLARRMFDLGQRPARLRLLPGPEGRPGRLPVPARRDQRGRPARRAGRGSGRRWPTTPRPGRCTRRSGGTRIVRRADAHRRIDELKRQPGREILMFGSRTLWHDLLAHDLVDELHLILGAAVIGAGTPIFGAKPPGRLRLAEVRRFDGSDNLVLRYQLGPDAG
jgi:RibD C-terminal domain